MILNGVFIVCLAGILVGQYYTFSIQNRLFQQQGDCFSLGIHCYCGDGYGFLVTLDTEGTGRWQVGGIQQSIVGVGDNQFGSCHIGTGPDRCLGVRRVVGDRFGLEAGGVIAALILNGIGIVARTDVLVGDGYGLPVGHRGRQGQVEGVAFGINGHCGDGRFFAIHLDAEGGNVRLVVGIQCTGIVVNHAQTGAIDHCIHKYRCGLVRRFVADCYLAQRNRVIAGLVLDGIGIVCPAGIPVGHRYGLLIQHRFCQFQGHCFGTGINGYPVHLDQTAVHPYREIIC